MTRRQKQTCLRLAVGAVFLLAALLLPTVLPISGPAETYIRLGLFLIPYLVIGGDVLFTAARNIVNGQVFDENFLMGVATIGALVLGEYTEAVAVMLFYQIGELFQDFAVNRSRQSIAALMDICPELANLEDGEGLRQVSPEEVQVGDIIVVHPGERIPLDGVVLDGTSQLDTSALTGESLPRDVAADDEIYSGSVNLSGLLRVRVTKPFSDSTVSRILEMVESAGDRKAKTENFITHFARWYTPLVCLCALLLAVVPPLFVGNWGVWIKRGLIFLVVSCPCALVISVPLSFFGGIGGASRKGVLVKGSNYLEALAKTDTVLFDKTGTLTQGRFSVTRIIPSGCSEDHLLELAACAETVSLHPIAQSIAAAWPNPIDAGRISEAEEIPGKGISAVVDGKHVLAGNRKLMGEHGISVEEHEDSDTVVYIAEDGVYRGCLYTADTIKPESETALRKLRGLGITRQLMLSGDREKTAAAVASQLELDGYYAGLLPEDKLRLTEQFLAEKRVGSTLAYVGDGINDAPVLMLADVGIAMGALGSDAAIEAADIVLMDDDPKGIVTALRIARKTMKIVYQNIVFALLVKLLVLILAALGLANMWLAVFADVGVAVLAILNAMRCMRLN